MLGETYDERKACFDSLRMAYGLASSVLHARNLKRRNGEVGAVTVSRAQGFRRDAILHRVRGGSVPNWDEVALGRGYRREP